MWGNTDRLNREDRTALPPQLRRSSFEEVLISIRNKSALITIDLSLAWLLVNWYPHLGLHISGDLNDVRMLLIVDYAFHLPVYASLAAMVWIVLGIARDIWSGQGPVTPSTPATAR